MKKWTQNRGLMEIKWWLEDQEREGTKNKRVGGKRKVGKDGRGRKRWGEEGNKRRKTWEWMRTTLREAKLKSAEEESFICAWIRDQTRRGSTKGEQTQRMFQGVCFCAIISCMNGKYNAWRDFEWLTRHSSWVEESFVESSPWNFRPQSKYICSPRQNMAVSCKIAKAKKGRRTSGIVSRREMKHAPRDEKRSGDRCVMIPDK